VESQVHENYRKTSQIDRVSRKPNGHPNSDCRSFEELKKHLRKLKFLQGSQDCKFRRQAIRMHKEETNEKVWFKPSCFYGHQGPRGVLRIN